MGRLRDKRPAVAKRSQRCPGTSSDRRRSERRNNRRDPHCTGQWPYEESGSVLQTFATMSRRRRARGYTTSPCGWRCRMRRHRGLRTRSGRTRISTALPPCTEFHLPVAPRHNCLRHTSHRPATNRAFRLDDGSRCIGPAYCRCPVRSNQWLPSRKTLPCSH
jgi:hypothetical protein